ncbi:MAG: hypothetical protein AB7L71_10360 [Vicinamibacterales bacterium]
MNWSGPALSALSTIGVTLLGAFLLALGATALARPRLAERFLGGFATSAGTHALELLARILAGAALVHAAPAMAGATVVRAFGWILIGTSLVLAVIPWRVHRRFAAWSVPQATQYLPLIALASIAGGLALLAALWLPGVAAR